MKKILISFFIYFSYITLSNSAELGVAQKLKELNYPWESFYIDNYRGSMTYWISLKEHLKLKPKFVALVEQELKLNGKNIKYKFFYNSRHNFFKMQKFKKEKKTILKLSNPLKKDELRPTLMDDKSLSLNNFVEKVLDHCKFSTLKGVKSSDDKRLKFSKRETCYVKYVNYTKFNNLSFESFEKNKDTLSFTTDKNVTSLNTKATQNVVKKIENKNLESKSKSKKIDPKKVKYLALKWHTFEDLIIGKIDYKNDISNGNIILELPNEKTICKGSFAVSPNFSGTWSISCPDNSNRSYQHKKNMTASGTMNKNDNNQLIGTGKDFVGRKVEFISNRIN